MRRITGTGRVIVGPFTYGINGERCILAYTSHGQHGIAAVIPITEGVAPSLWDVAARNLPSGIAVKDQSEQYGRWCLNVAWSMEVIGSPGSLRLNEAEWSLDVHHAVNEFKPHQYGRSVCGHYGVQVGTLTLVDDEQVRSLRESLAE